MPGANDDGTGPDAGAVQDDRSGPGSACDQFLGSAIYSTVSKTLWLEVDMVKVKKIVSRWPSC